MVRQIDRGERAVGRAGIAPLSAVRFTDPVPASCAGNGSLRHVGRSGRLARAAANARVGTHTGGEQRPGRVARPRPARAHSCVAVAAVLHVRAAAPGIAASAGAEILKEAEELIACPGREVDRRTLGGAGGRGETARRVHQAVAVVVIAVADLRPAAAESGQASAGRRARRRGSRPEAPRSQALQLVPSRGRPRDLGNNSRWISTGCDDDRRRVENSTVSENFPSQRSFSPGHPRLRGSRHACFPVESRQPPLC